MKNGRLFNPQCHVKPYDARVVVGCGKHGKMVGKPRALSGAGCGKYGKYGRFFDKIATI